MSQVFASVLLLSLLWPSGFNFFTAHGLDSPYAQALGQFKPAPVRITSDSFGLRTSADSIVVIDDASTTILYSKNSGATMPIASVSKLLTALVFLDTKPNWDATVTMAKDDFRQGGVLRLAPGEIVTVKDLFHIMLVASANEAAIALARVSAIPDFAAAMNNKAKAVGMWQSYFANPAALAPAMSHDLLI